MALKEQSRHYRKAVLLNSPVYRKASLAGPWVIPPKKSGAQK